MSGTGEEVGGNGWLKDIVDTQCEPSVGFVKVPMKEKVIITLFKRPFNAKKDGVFLFVISSFIPEIFRFRHICKLGTDNVTRCEV